MTTTTTTTTGAPSHAAACPARRPSVPAPPPETAAARPRLEGQRADGPTPPRPGSRSPPPPPPPMKSRRRRRRRRRYSGTRDAAAAAPPAVRRGARMGRSARRLRCHIHHARTHPLQRGAALGGCVLLRQRAAGPGRGTVVCQLSGRALSAERGQTDSCAYPWRQQPATGQTGRQAGSAVPSARTHARHPAVASSDNCRTARQPRDGGGSDDG
jgi:hypothetical protein